MLNVVDRIQLVTDDAEKAASGWQTLLGAELLRKDRVACLGANRAVYALGRSQIEILEPDGAGVAEEALRKRGRPHLFAAGASTRDIAALKAHLEQTDVECVEEAGQLHVLARNLNGGDFRFVISPSSDNDPVGAIDFLYEVTILGPECRELVSEITRIFNLQDECFCPIESEHFQYDGQLTLFDRDRLDRFEAITPWNTETTMGRFLERQGANFYMTFAETSSMTTIEQRALEIGAAITVDRPESRAPDQTPDQMWLHPPALGGVMLGLSRPTMAWKWSGHPERVEGVPS